MTFTNLLPVNFGIFYISFQLYWNCCRDRGRRLNDLEVLLVTNVIYIELRYEWEKCKWDVNELNWICEGLNNNCNLLDPTNFINDQFAYLDHIKTCYYLRN